MDSRGTFVRAAGGSKDAQGLDSRNSNFFHLNYVTTDTSGRDTGEVGALHIMGDPR